MAPREAGANYAAVWALSSAGGAGCATHRRSGIRGIYSAGTGGGFLSNADAVAADGATILRMIHAYRAAAGAGRSREAEEMLTRLWRLAPNHPAVLNELGLSLMQRGEAARARELFQRAAGADPSHPALWSNLASSLHALRLPEEEMQAIERALALEPRHPTALLQKGALIEERG